MLLLVATSLGPCNFRMRDENRRTGVVYGRPASPRSGKLNAATKCASRAIQFSLCPCLHEAFGPFTPARRLGRVFALASTTVVDRMLSWFQTRCGGRN